MKTNHDIKLGVSLYCYQDNFYFKKLDLDGVLAAAAGAGAEGIEVFPETMMPEWPYITDAFVDAWFGKMDRYGLEPVCLDHFADRIMYKTRHLTDDELAERTIWYLKAAKRLGCTHVRMMHDHHLGDTPITPCILADVKVFEKVLPVAHELDLMMALECHSPTMIEDPCQQQYLELAERMKMPNIGLQIDFSSYEYCLSTADLGQAVRNGYSEDAMWLLRNKQVEAYRNGVAFNIDELMPELLKAGLTQEQASDRGFLHMTSLGKGSYEKLEEMASQVVYIHGKFYDIDENGQVDNMDYPKIFDCLKKGGYKGYINSEFEGNRRMNDAGFVNEIEYVRKHHILMRECLGYED